MVTESDAAATNAAENAARVELGTGSGFHSARGQDKPENGV